MHATSNSKRSCPSSPVDVAVADAITISSKKPKVRMSVISKSKAKSAASVPAKESLSVITTPATTTTSASTTTATVRGYGLFVSMLMDLPLPIRVHILNYFDETKQEELRTVTVLSKQFNDDCKRIGIDWILIPEFVLRPRKRNGEHTISFFQKLKQQQRDADETRHRQFQRYRRMSVKSINKFHGYPAYVLLQMIRENNMQLPGIESLDISLPSPSQAGTKKMKEYDLPLALIYLLPNLCDIIFSNTAVPSHILFRFLEKCPRLEKVSWNHIPVAANMDICGESLRSGNALREINMDDSIFTTGFGGERRVMKKIADLHNDPTLYLFHRCLRNNQVLVRVSIRNAKLAKVPQSALYGKKKVIWEGKNVSQNMLIKFIRNGAPSTLKWFRSDLTPQNIMMLKQERPDIDFQN